MKLGKFKIHKSLYDNDNGLKDVKAVLANVAVTRCEYLFGEGVFKFTGISDMFDDIDYSLIIPEYKFNLLWCEEDVRIEVVKKT